MNLNEKMKKAEISFIVKTAIISRVEIRLNFLPIPLLNSLLTSMAHLRTILKFSFLLFDFKLLVRYVWQRTNLENK